MGIIRPEAIVESYPSILDVYDDGLFYIALYGIDHIITLDDDPSFPSSSNLDIHNIATIKSCIGTEYIDNPKFLCTIEAAVVEPIQLTERVIHGHPIRAFNTRISDGTGEIDVFGHCEDKICEVLRDGDIIKIIGAYIHPTLILYEEGEFEISYVELRLSPYGSIAIIEPYVTYDPYYDKSFV